ncbi:MAG: hypothetical protein RR413_02885, partial [Christensenellaceae bacterium]
MKISVCGARCRYAPCTLQTGTLDLHTVFTLQTGTLYICEKVSSTAPLVYINADFDTMGKALSSRKRAEKGAVTGLP